MANCAVDRREGEVEREDNTQQNEGKECALVTRQVVGRAAPELSHGDEATPT